MDKNVINLISELEYMIGSECYNPNSYDGWTGVEGLGYRYPVKYLLEESNELHTTRGEAKLTCPEAIDSMKYVFGSNHLFIGKGIYKILSELEKRYGINIEKLEAEYQSKQKKDNTREK